MRVSLNLDIRYHFNSAQQYLTLTLSETVRISPGFSLTYGQIQLERPFWAFTRTIVMPPGEWNQWELFYTASNLSLTNDRKNLSSATLKMLTYSPDQHFESIPHSNCFCRKSKALIKRSLNTKPALSREDRGDKYLITNRKLQKYETEKKVGSLFVMPLCCNNGR